MKKKREKRDDAGENKNKGFFLTDQRNKIIKNSAVEGIPWYTKRIKHSPKHINIFLVKNDLVIILFYNGIYLTKRFDIWNEKVVGCLAVVALRLATKIPGRHKLATYTIYILCLNETNGSALILLYLAVTTTTTCLDVLKYIRQQQQL